MTLQKINPVQYSPTWKSPVALLFFLFVTFNLLGQNHTFLYQRALENTNQNWGIIPLPNPVFKHLNPDFSDLRILSYSDKDTLEAPYVLKIKGQEVQSIEKPYLLLNRTQDAENFYYTFQLTEVEPVNEVVFQFGIANFDWNIQWEGSSDLKQWYTILDDYRILGISNDLTDYRHTKLAFPTVNFPYFRLKIPSEVNPQLLSAHIQLTKIDEAQYNTYKLSKFNRIQDKPQKLSFLFLTLEEEVPVNYIKVFCNEAIPYARNVIIETLSDSIKTSEGWKPYYDYLTGGVLNAKTTNEFIFEGKLTKNIKITIQNKDNLPLKIDSVVVKGYAHELWVRFPDLNRKYFLAYGSKRAVKPEYDLSLALEENTMPIAYVKLGPEISLEKQKEKSKPLFDNPIYLWGIILTVMLLLGFFSFKMLQKKS